MAVTYDIIKAVDNGAQFFNADLHVHSFGASHDVKDSTMTMEAIVDAAVKMGIRLLAITDHNSDANTEKSISFAQKYTGHILVLAGVEITTSHGHLLAYFAPDQAAHVRNLLAKINLQGELGEKGRLRMFPLTVSGSNTTARANWQKLPKTRSKTHCCCKRFWIGIYCSPTLRPRKHSW